MAKRATELQELQTEAIQVREAIDKSVQKQATATFWENVTEHQLLSASRLLKEQVSVEVAELC